MPEDLLRAAGPASILDRLSLVMTRLRSSGTPPRSDVETSLARTFWLPTSRTFTMTRIGPDLPAHPRRHDRPTGGPSRLQPHRHRGLLARPPARRPRRRGHRHPGRRLDHPVGAGVRRLPPGRPVAPVHAAQADHLRPSRPADRGRRAALGPDPADRVGRQREHHGRPAARSPTARCPVRWWTSRCRSPPDRPEHPDHRGHGAHREHTELLLEDTHRHAHRHRRGGDPRPPRRRPVPAAIPSSCRDDLL